MLKLFNGDSHNTLTTEIHCDVSRGKKLYQSVYFIMIHSTMKMIIYREQKLSHHLWVVENYRSGITIFNICIGNFIIINSHVCKTFERNVAETKAIQTMGKGEGDAYRGS